MNCEMFDGNTNKNFKMKDKCENIIANVVIIIIFQIIVCALVMPILYLVLEEDFTFKIGLITFFIIFVLVAIVSAVSIWSD